MQKYIYNKLISDKYPLLQKELVSYFEKIISPSNENKNNSDLLIKEINSINNLIEEALKVNKSDVEISELIKMNIQDKNQDQVQNQDKNQNQDEVQNQSNENNVINQSNNNNKDDSKENEEYKSETNTITEHKDSEGPNLLEQQRLERLEKEQLIADEKEQEIVDEEMKADEKVNDEKEDKQKEEILKNDMNEINNAKEQLEDAYQHYQDDRKIITQTQSNLDPDKADKLTSGLAVAGSVATLGAIGSGLYFALPLLLGGSKKNKIKNNNHIIKKTRRNKK
jgi:hypothetical protein